MTKRVRVKKAEGVLPATPLDKAMALQGKLLSYSSKAHTNFTALDSFGIAQNMADWMKNFEDAADGLFKEFRKKTQAQVNTEEEYAKLMEDGTNLIDVFDQYSPLAGQMKRRVQGGKKAEKEEESKGPKKRPRKS